MQHAAVMTGLAPADAGLLFEQGDGGIGKPLFEPVGRGKTYDSAANDQYAIHLVWVLKVGQTS